MKEELNFSEDYKLAFEPVVPRVPMPKFLRELFLNRNIPLSHTLERIGLDMINDDKEYNREIWCELKRIEDSIENLKEYEKQVTKDYDRIMRSIATKQEKLYEEKKNIENGIEKNYAEMVAQDIDKARVELSHEISLCAKKVLQSELNNTRIVLKKISLNDVESICSKHNVTPQMVLRFIDSDHIMKYFDKDCQTYCR